jgi:hypothetical protein
MSVRVRVLYPRISLQFTRANIDVLMGAFRSLGEYIVRLRTLLDLPLGARARVHQPISQRKFFDREGLLPAFFDFYYITPYCSGTGVSIEAETK